MSLEKAHRRFQFACENGDTREVALALSALESALAPKPGEFLDDEGNIKICSWCQEEKGVQPQRGESHSICRTHSRELVRRAGLKLAEVK